MGAGDRFDDAVSERREVSLPQRVLSLLVPRKGYRLHAGLRFGPGGRGLLDVYAPERPTGSVVIFFYGGRWTRGHRSGYRFVGQALASRGITVVVPDYRLYPEVGFPDFVHDAARAVAWVDRHVGDYGGDPGRVVLMGHSAGAHIAALLGTAQDYLRSFDSHPQRLRGVIGLAGPYDFLPLEDPDLREIFGPQSEHPRSQPINHVSGDEPPFLLLTGGRDRTVGPGNSKRLWRRINERGGRARVVFYQKLGHLGILLALATPLRFLGPVLGDVVAFVDAATRGALPADFHLAPVEKQVRVDAA